MRRLAPLLAVALVAATAVAFGSATARTERRCSAATFYVAPTGRDRNDGRSPARAWRSVTRVNVARLAPGSCVRFAGGASWRAPLTPHWSGTRSAPIDVGSYGRGLAGLNGGIFLRGVSWLELHDLAITGPPQGVLASRDGGGTKDIVLSRLAISSVAIAINSANTRDTRWRVVGNHIDGTQDSGIIVGGSRLLIARNTITNTGLSRTIPYGKHGIYAKGPSLRMIGNTIANFQSNGISTRYQDALVEDNTISGGPIGVAYFRSSSVAGVTRILGNRISRVTSAGIYLEGPTAERFVVKGNTLTDSAAPPLALHDVVVSP
jgi:hypothetical protein